MLSKVWGPLLVGTAAFLWATDTLFRVPMVSHINPAFIVFGEHLIGVLVLTPWVLLKHRKELLGLGFVPACALIVIGAGGSGLGTVLFTAAFQYAHPSIVILLQKIQPVIVVLLAAVFLGERPAPGFFAWALVALLAGVVLSFPDFDFHFVAGGLDLKSTGVLYSLIAASLWAVSTVVGKAILAQIAPALVTFWRFVFGFAGLGIVVGLSGARLPIGEFSHPEALRSLFYMALIPGLLSMVLYYQGLKRTPASVATFAELVFPISAVVINTFFLNAPLSYVQLGAAAVLLFAVTRVGSKVG